MSPKTARTRRGWWGWSLALLALASSAPGLLGRDARHPRILFLHLRMQGDKVTLVQAQTVAGWLKTPPESRGDLELELWSADRTPLWRRRLPDPLVRRYETEDPDRPGMLMRTEVRSNEAEFSLRVPGHLGARQLAVYRIGARAAGLTGAATSAPRQLLGLIDLPKEAE
jgi:hypothetical protein